MFHWADWLVLGVYLLGTSWLAEKLAGQRQTIRDFFLGGRKLPWWAVAGSLVASEISGVTFVSIPASVYAAGGNYTYVMILLGFLAARFVIAYVFVPAYYRREIYSPYEFMGRELGPAVHHTTTVLFFIGSFLAQGSRLFLAALVLNVLTRMGIVWAILAVGGISVVWTWMGGINSVVWTDMVQFAILFLGAAVALVAVVLAVPGGVPEIVRLGQAAGKFQWYDLAFDRTTEYTLWTGLLGATFLGMGSHGTDQNTCQRLFCCRDERDARKAILASGVAILLGVFMLTVGVGVYAYFAHFPPTGALAELARERRDNIFPVFILSAMPTGMKGLMFAAIFSAATATSTLAAMAQGGIAIVQEPLRRRGWSEERFVRLSRVFVAVAAAGLCGVAILLIDLKQYPDILRIALAMAGYTYGPMLGILLLALLPFRRDARGLIWGVPFSLLLIVALNWQHIPWVCNVITGCVIVLVAIAPQALRREPLKISWVMLGAAVVLAVVWVRLRNAECPGQPWLKLAFPWHYPIGTAMTLALGVALGRKRVAPPDAAPLSFGP